MNESEIISRMSYLECANRFMFLIFFIFSLFAIKNGYYGESMLGYVYSLLIVIAFYMNSSFFYQVERKFRKCEFQSYFWTKNSLIYVVSIGILIAMWMYK